VPDDDPERYFDFFIKAPVAGAATGGPIVVVCLLIGLAFHLNFEVAMIVSLVIGAIPTWFVVKRCTRPPEPPDWGPTSSVGGSSSD